MDRASALAKQCDEIGWSLITETIEPVVGKRAEELVLSRFAEQGYSGSWCEGASFKLLMKAASLPFVLSQELTSPRIAADPVSTTTYFHRRLGVEVPWTERDGAVSAFFEAHCKTFLEKREQLIACIRGASTRDVELAIREICGNPFIRDWFPRVTPAFLAKLWRATGPDFVARIAEIFIRSPYDYRAGWPDLTLIGAEGVWLVEVKKNKDRFQTSQLRFARDIAKPLGLRCSVFRAILK